VRTLSKMLDAVFRAPAPSRRDPHRRARAEAKALALALGSEVEPLRDGGMNVWPPAGIGPDEDPFDGDHYAQNWTEAATMLRAYRDASAGRRA
jgi:hypothetical protein